MSEPVLKLGEHYVSDFLNADESSADRKKYSLDLYMDEAIGAVRLRSEDLPPADAMWGRYWYRSGTNVTMTAELGKIVQEVTERVHYKTGDVWLDIACNDGTLLRQVPLEFKKVGIDPCDDSFYELSSKHATVVQDYFSADAYKRAFASADEVKKAKVITCIAMFYDLDNPHTFIQDLYDVLDDNGIIVLQMSYTPLMLQQMAFDNICHEHVYYHSLTSIQNLFKQHGMMIVDANVNDTNGGSIRIYLAKENCSPETFGTQQLRQVCAYRADSILNFERIADISDPVVWQTFGTKINALKISLLDFIKTARSEGKTIYGYGASTKGNTLLQLFGLTANDITAIAERSPYKFGKKTVGTEIPIVSEEEMRAAKPDYLLVLPWHFIDEFVKRERDYLEAGGALVVPCPEFKVITKADL
jgi:NDP-4-keto-2,6-dideoxyhexose 3-C-methyltransferase